MQSDTSRLSRRRALILVFNLSAAATLLSACGPTAPSAAPTTSPAKPAAAPPAPAASAPTPAASAPTPASAAASAGQPKTGGTLRVGVIGDVATLDGHSWGPKNGFSIFMIYD